MPAFVSLIAPGFVNDIEKINLALDNPELNNLTFLTGKLKIINPKNLLLPELNIKLNQLKQEIIIKEKQQKAKIETERKAKIETERKAKIEIKRKAKIETERKAKIETERKAKIKAQKKTKVIKPTKKIKAKAKKPRYCKNYNCTDLVRKITIDYNSLNTNEKNCLKYCN
jgi:hypothetical protein